MEAVGQSRCLVANSTRNDTDNAIDYYSSSQLSTRQDIVANADFACDKVFADTMVDAFVVATQNDDVFECRKSVGFVLVVAYSVGRSVDNLVVVALAAKFLDGSIYGLDFHNHTRLATKRIVVGGASSVVGVVAQIVYVYLGVTCILGTLYYRLAEG